MPIRIKGRAKKPWYHPSWLAEPALSGRSVTGTPGADYLHIGFTRSTPEGTSTFACLALLSIATAPPCWGS